MLAPWHGRPISKKITMPLFKKRAGAVWQITNKFQITMHKITNKKY
jgi:hypothetical protein